MIFPPFWSATAAAPLRWDTTNESETWTFSNGDATARFSSGAVAGVVSTTSHSSGKRYFEIKFELTAGYADTVRHDVGITRSLPAVAEVRDAGVAYNRAGTIFKDAASVTTVTAIANNDIVMFAVDFDAAEVWVGLNGSWNGDPSAGTGASVTGLTAGTYYIGATYESAAANFNTYTLYGTDATINYAVPTGFTAFGE